MPISIQTGCDLSTGGNYLRQEGWYHMIVTGATDQPTKRDGTLINNVCFQLQCVVATGTSPGCQDKAFDLTLFNPKGDGSMGSEISQKKIDRTLLATNVMTEADAGKAISVDIEAMVGQQFVAHIKSREEGKYFELNYADIFHVDDPEVANQPKSEQALKLLPPQCRRVGDRDSKGAVAAAAAGTTPAATPAAPPMNLDSVDI